MIDELDKRILKVLQANCRKSFREISKEVGSTTVTVINRVKKMEEAGIIKGYSVRLDREKLGYTITGLITITATDMKALKRLEEKLRGYQNIMAVYGISGEVDIVLAGKFKNLRELHEFVNNEILSTGDAAKTTTHIVASILKEDIKPKID